MRVLLDHDVDVRLRHDFPRSFDVETTQYRGWQAYDNGALLRRADETFDARVTLDGSIPFQQHLPGYALRVVVLKTRAQQRAAFTELVPGVAEALAALSIGAHAFVVGEERAGTLHLPDGQRLFVVRTGETPTVAQAETPFGSEELFA